MPNTRNAEVIIAGAGPTGLLLAAELALAHVDVVVVEKRATQDLPGLRAGGLHARSLELLDQRGVVERFVAQGKTMPILSFGGALDISDFPTRHPYTLALAQEPIERTLLAWVEELKVPVLRPKEIVRFEAKEEGGEEGVDVFCSDGERLHGKFLVACDGGRSSIRKQAGIAFTGWDASVTYLLAEAEVTGAPPPGIRAGPRGTNGIGPLKPGDASDKRWRMVIVEDAVREGEPTVDELRAGLVGVWGSDFGVHNVTWLSRFSDATRQAQPYRAGRVLVAGDAAHVHSPVGGQGLNLGLHDAVNLGWKLAQVVKGTSPLALLDTYQQERHPPAARALKTTLAQTALARGDDRTVAARDTLTALLKLPEARKHTAGELSGLDIAYDLGGAHPLVGRRMPDLDVETAGGVRRVFSFLRQARPLLLLLNGAQYELGAFSDRVQRIEATHEGAWELPVLGVVRAPRAVLVRPDGHVAWVGEGSDEGLREALTRWFGLT